MTLTKHELAQISPESVHEGDGRFFQYQVSGLPAGEHALISEFPGHGWRILRWNEEWHGNWTGEYPTADAALEALREEMRQQVA
jgi:hypothetical protein